jgi:hypothetical protein
VRCGFVRELLQGKKEKKKVLISSLWAFLKLFFSYHSGVSEREFLLFFFLFSSIFLNLFIQKNPKKSFFLKNRAGLASGISLDPLFLPTPLPTAKIRRVRPPLEIFVFFDASLDFAILLSFSFFLLPPPPSRGWERVTVCVCAGVCVCGEALPPPFFVGVSPPPTSSS